MKKLRGLDGRAIKEFFIWNVEKIAFGVSMLLVALFIYGGLGQESYAKKPEDLQNSITAAKRNIEATTVLPPTEKAEQPRFVEFAKRANEIVPGSAFPLARTLHEDKTKTQGSKRGEPEYLPVIELEATQGVGPFAFKDPDKKFVVAGAGQPGGVGPEAATTPGRPGTPGNKGAAAPPKKPAKTTGQKGAGSLGSRLAGGGEGGQPAPGLGGEGAGAGMGPQPGMGPDIARGVQASPDSLVEGVRWACVTGLVPYKLQREKYREQFEAAAYIDEAKDEPYWLGYLVERAEVTDAEIRDPSKAVWQPISLKQALELTKKWAVRGGDVVDPTYTQENITFPVGPLLERNWDKAVAHSKIPLLDLTQRGSNAAGVAVEENASLTAASGPTDLDELSAMLASRNKPTTGPGAAGRTTPVPGSRYGGGMSRGPFGGGEGGEGMGLGGGGRMPRGFGPQGGAGIPAGPDPNAPKEIEHLMFRFFDFTVEEGKRYRYRVQLVLENPNYKVKPFYLKNADLAKDQVRKTEWSEPSPVVSISSYNFLFAGAVTAATKPVEEPKAKLVAVQLDPKLGTKAAYEMRPPKPGDKSEKGRDPQSVNRGQLIQFTAKVHVVHPLTKTAKEETIEFNSNMVVVDMRGGERFNEKALTDRDVIPGEVLLMDANGALIFRSEAEDETNYQAEVGWIERVLQGGNGAVPGGGLPGGEGSPVPIRGRRPGEGA